jgi:hypothetical protein
MSSRVLSNEEAMMYAPGRLQVVSGRIICGGGVPIAVGDGLLMEVLVGEEAVNAVGVDVDRRQKLPNDRSDFAGLTLKPAGKVKVLGAVQELFDDLVEDWFLFRGEVVEEVEGLAAQLHPEFLAEHVLDNPPAEETRPVPEDPVSDGLLAHVPAGVIALNPAFRQGLLQGGLSEAAALDANWHVGNHGEVPYYQLGVDIDVERGTGRAR